MSRDVSHLKTYAFGSRNPLWWGNQAFMVIEGLSFAFAIATYFYLQNQNQYWPLNHQLPGLLFSSSFIGLLVLSEIPNVWVKKQASTANLAGVRAGLLIMSAVGALALAIRWFEFKGLHVRWDENAYGSIVWFLLGLHTFHLITDFCETLVMTFMIHVGPVDMRRFPEVQDNQDYWHFVVFFSGVVYVVIYWVPRWFGALP